MKKGAHKGFTIVEVTLFLAVTGALLAGILAGSVSSIKRHRYNDSVNDFVEFLRRTYSEVVNVENERIGTIGDSRSCTVSGVIDSNFKLIGQGGGNNEWLKWVKEETDLGVYDGKPGRTQCAVYGMLVTFGEDDDTTIYTYDVIGRTLENHKEFNANTTFKDINEALDFVNADIITMHVESKNDMPVCSLTAAGNNAKYTLQWDARAENTKNPESTEPSERLFKGSLLIVRSPVSGTIHTLFLDKPIGANAVITNANNDFSVSNSEGYCADVLTGYRKAVTEKRLLKSYTEPDADDKFSVQEVNICVASDDSFDMDNRRRNVRILADGRNATAVELVAMDNNNPETGNKCER
ncbi:hypothetical protein IKF76_01325 [Candidatus Saccharibacteria bacterium]|nr:hypothetical protein [Candidatus Saccharibacteria bacterium]